MHGYLFKIFVCIGFEIKYQESRLDIVAVVLAVANTQVFNLIHLVLLTLVSTNSPVSIKPRRLAWSLIGSLSISSTIRYFGSLMNNIFTTPAFVLLLPMAKYACLSPSLRMSASRKMVFALAGGPTRST